MSSRAQPRRACCATPVYVWRRLLRCADAAPYFRIFNPVTQGETFDPAGDYIRRWVPELAGLPDCAIHRPWESAAAVDYPPPMVDHAAARARALEAYRAVK